MKDFVNCWCCGAGIPECPQILDGPYRQASFCSTECSTGQDYAGSVKCLLWVEHQAGSKQKPFEHGCGLGVGKRSQGPWLALELEERCARTKADSRRIPWEVETVPESRREPRVEDGGGHSSVLKVLKN